MLNYSSDKIILDLLDPIQNDDTNIGSVGGGKQCYPTDDGCIPFPSLYREGALTELSRMQEELG